MREVVSCLGNRADRITGGQNGVEWLHLNPSERSCVNHTGTTNLNDAHGPVDAGRGDCVREGRKRERSERCVDDGSLRCTVAYALQLDPDARVFIKDESEVHLSFAHVGKRTRNACRLPSRRRVDDDGRLPATGAGLGL